MMALLINRSVYLNSVRISNCCYHLSTLPARKESQSNSDASADVIRIRNAVKRANDLYVSGKKGLTSSLPSFKVPCGFNLSNRRPAKISIILQSKSAPVEPTGGDEEASVKISRSNHDAEKEEKTPKEQHKHDGRPSPEQLEHVYLSLSESIPHFFTDQHPYDLYSDNMIFEDNIRNLMIRGKRDYVISLAMLKIKAHMNYAHVKMEVLKISQHPDEGAVKCRWRVVGGPGFFKLLLTFWRMNIIQSYRSKTPNANTEWIDGFSIFHINGEGKIYKHVCDKMMPDDDKVVSGTKNPVKNVNVAI